MKRSQQEEIDILVRARCPLIYVVSWEESRVEDFLKRTAFEMNKALYFWSVTKGLFNDKGFSDTSLADPKAVLTHIDNNREEAFFVLRDFHPYWEDPKIVRGVRDLVAPLKASYKTVFLISPKMAVPLELEKDMTVVDYDLPQKGDLNVLFEEMVTASQQVSHFQVNIPPEDKEKLIQAALGMTLNEAETAFARAVVIDSQVPSEDVAIVLEEKKQIVRKSRVLEYYDTSDNISHVGGLDYLKDWVRKRTAAFSDRARDFGLPEPKGVLLLGIQGCGKSLTCKAISSLWQLPLLRLDMGSIFGSYIGQSEENLRKAIKTAETVAPCVLWLDEIEKGLSGVQGGGGTSDSGTSSRVFSTLLTWLQEKVKPVFVTATANNIRSLPPELLRKGRLDEIFFVDLPSHNERRDIFQIHLRRKNRQPENFQLDVLAQMTRGFSGAEIEQSIVSALYNAFFKGEDLTQAELAHVLSESVPLSKTMKEQIDELREWASSRARPASMNQGGQ